LFGRGEVSWTTKRGFSSFDNGSRPPNIELEKGIYCRLAQGGGESTGVKRGRYRASR